MAWFRLDPRNEDPERLLDPERQRSEPWAGTIYGRCDKCAGEGRTMHECESCVVRPRRDCPACEGEVRYLATCPACRGSGRIDDSQRHGVSVFPDEDGLYRYMLGRDGDLAHVQLVVLEGAPSEDDDFDADAGAVLIVPTRIVEVRAPDRRRIAELRRKA
jgi:DnaJ-class molecular chaperone